MKLLNKNKKLGTIENNKIIIGYRCEGEWTYIYSNNLSLENELKNQISLINKKTKTGDYIIGEYYDEEIKQMEYEIGSKDNFKIGNKDVFSNNSSLTYGYEQIIKYL